MMEKIKTWYGGICYEEKLVIETVKVNWWNWIQKKVGKENEIVCWCAYGKYGRYVK